MNSKEGNAKALLGFFHKGAIMKWVWIFLVALAMPLVTYAEEPKQKVLELRMFGYHDELPSFLKSWDFPAMSKFVVEALTPVENVTVHITFYVPDSPDFSLDQFKAVRCGVLWPEGSRTFPQMVPIHSGDGLVVWVPRIDPPNSVTIRIGWPEKGLNIRAVTMKVKSDEYFELKRWEHQALEYQREEAQEASRPFREPDFRVVQLDQVCERIVPYEVPKSYLMAR